MSGIRTNSSKGLKPSIEAFRALAIQAETRKVTETARRLGVSQPVVTKKLQVFKNKKACGAILLDPEGTNELTDAGEAVLPAIRELVARYDRILSYLHAERVSPQAVRVAAGNFAAEHYLPPAITQLREMLEDCQIETRICRGHDRIAGTAQGVFDLAIVTHDKEQIRLALREERIDDSLLTVERLGRHPMCVVARADSDPGKQLKSIGEEDRIPLNRLISWELVGPDRDSGLRRQLEQRLKGKSLYFVTEGGGWTAAKEFARQGLGVALLPLAVMKDADAPTLVHRRLAAEFDVTDYLIYRRDETGPFVRHARKAIKAAVASHNARLGSHPSIR